MLEWLFILILHEFSRDVCGSFRSSKDKVEKYRFHIYPYLFILYIYICLAILQPESPTKTKQLEPQL